MTSHRKPFRDSDTRKATPRHGVGKTPRDVIEFYSRWSEFREIAVALTRRGDLSPLQRETVNWIILLFDRIAKRDIGT